MHSRIILSFSHVLDITLYNGIILCVGTEEMYWLIIAYGKNVEKEEIINRLRNMPIRECIQDDANGSHNYDHFCGNG